jgi:hypothetical protein
MESTHRDHVPSIDCLHPVEPYVCVRFEWGSCSVAMSVAAYVPWVGVIVLDGSWWCAWLCGSPGGSFDFCE